MGGKKLAKSQRFHQNHEGLWIPPSQGFPKKTLQKENAAAFGRKHLNFRDSSACNHLRGERKKIRGRKCHRSFLDEKKKKTFFPKRSKGVKVPGGRGHKKLAVSTN